MFVEEEGKALGKEEKSSCPCNLVALVERHRGGEEDRVREGSGEDVGGVGAGGEDVGGVGAGGDVVGGGGVSGEIVGGGGGGGLEGGRGRGRCCGATCWGGRVELVTSIIQQIV